MKRTILACLLVVGCTQPVSPNAPVSKADIAAVEVTLTGVIRLANACLNLPSGPCRAQPLRANMIADIHKAADAFKRVQTNNNAGVPVSLTALNEAIAQLTAETPATTK